MIFDYFNNITFGQPLFFILFAIIPFLIFWKIVKGKKQTAAIGFLLQRVCQKHGPGKIPFRISIYFTVAGIELYHNCTGPAANKI